MLYISEQRYFYYEEKSMYTVEENISLCEQESFFVHIVNYFISMPDIEPVYMSEKN